MSQARFTRLSKTLAAALVSLWVVQYFFPTSLDYLALVPGRTLPCLWNLVTAGLVSSSLVKLAFEVAALLLLARVVEPIYGSKEFLRFLLVVDVSTCVLTFITVYIVYAVSPAEHVKLLYSKFLGFHGILAGLFVALKQMMPDHELRVLQVLTLKAKNVPSLFVLVSTLLAVALRAPLQLLFLYFGTYCAWLYLRFFQQQPDSSYKGDPSDDFRFASFFPGFLRPAVNALATGLGIVTRLRHGELPGGGVKPFQLKQGPSLLGTDQADASRRRERGAKALEERLGQKQGGPDGGADVEAPPDLPATGGGGKADPLPVSVAAGD